MNKTLRIILTFVGIATVRVVGDLFENGVA
jgi:hypothetical protein